MPRSLTNTASSQSESAPFVQSDSMFSTYEAPPSFPFPSSEQANLEYSILSTILGNSPESATSAGSPATAQQHSHAAPASSSYVAQQQQQPSANMVNGAWPAAGSGYAEQQQPPPPPSSSAAPASSGYIAPSYSQGSSQFPAPSNGTPTQGYPEYTAAQPQQPQTSSLSNYAGQAPQPPPNQVSPAAGQLAQRQPPIVPTRSSSTTLLDRSVSAGTASWVGPAPSDVGFHDGASVYKSVTKPYDYTEGYHFLMKHLPTR